MVKRVVGLDPQLRINTLSEPKVLRRRDVPVVDTGPIECSAIPSIANLACGRQGEYIRIEIVVKGTLVPGQHWVSSDDHLGSIASAGDVLIVGRAQVDVHGLARDERSYSGDFPVVQCPSAELIVPKRARLRQF